MKAQLLPPQLHEYFAYSTVTDILVNQSTEVWIERHGILERGNDLQPGQI